MYALRDLHAFGYIEKPFAPSQVENLLRDALHFKTQKEKDAMMFFRKDGILYPVKCNRVDLYGTNQKKNLYSYEKR